MKSLLALCIFLAAPASFAGLFFEPLVGYESGAGKYTSQASLPTRSFKMQGPMGGARLGAQVSRFWLAIEPVYSQGSIQSDYSDGSNYTDTYSQTRVNGLIGFEPFSHFGLWGGAAVFNQQKENYSTRSATITFNSFKAGFAFRYRRFSLNFEYQSETPTKIKDSSSGEVNLSVNYSKLSSSRSSVSMSWFF